jgi:hypothetical protein
MALRIAWANVIAMDVLSQGTMPLYAADLASIGAIFAM